MSSGVKDHSDVLYNSQGGKPWHELGISFDGPMSVPDIRERAPWWFEEVVKEPIYRNGKPVPGHYFTVKGGRVLGHVGDEYVPVQDIDLAHAAEQYVQDPNGPIFETLGHLWGGRKSFILARFPEDMVLKGRNGREDIIGKYLLFANAHDGSHRVRIQETPVRVVCQNTLNMAFHGSKRETSAWFCHSGDVRAKLDNVKDVLQIAAKAFEETKELYDALIRVEPTPEQVETVLRTLIPDTKTDRAKLQRERVLTLAEAGTGNAAFAGTGWALYNGVTELSDHVNNAKSSREDAQDMRVNSAWFGSGQAFKARALELIAQTCLN